MFTNKQHESKVIKITIIHNETINRGSRAVFKRVEIKSNLTSDNSKILCD